MKEWTRDGVALLPFCVALLGAVVWLGAVPEPARAADVIVTGEVHDWLGEADLEIPHAAGTDLADEQVGEADEVTIDIVDTNGGDWELWMDRDCDPDDTWPEEWDMYQRRTSSHSNVWGGTGWTGPITPSEMIFFEGSGDVSGIEVQFKYTGVSLYNVPDTAECEIDYELEVFDSD